MSYLALYLLGPPRIENDGQTIEIGRRKALALIAYLAIAGRSVQRDALINLLWPEYDQTAGRAALGTTLWAVKKSLGERWVETDRQTIRLDGGANLWSDVTHFHELIAESKAHGHPESDVCPACLTPLTEAAELYRDDFLAGFTLRDSIDFDDWQRFQTESIRRKMGHVLDKLVRLHSSREEFTQAITYARQWLALDPLNEPAHRQMMMLFTWSDQRNAALQQYQECVRLLEEDIGLSPQAATMELYEKIRDNQVPPPTKVAYVHPVAPLPVSLPLHPVPFLGREKELADINRILQDPACRLLTLTGPGGIGKTRLALQAATDNADMFPHGVCFVPLDHLDSPDLIYSAIADALKLPLQGEASPEVQVLTYLRDRELFLILDNLEHLIAPSMEGGRDCVSQIIDMLKSTSDLKIMATSRERLNLQWEWSLEVKGLAFPKPGDTGIIEDYSAVRLFLQSARRIHSHFSLSEADRSHVAHICQYLEGMPLGIELAAAWIQSLTCQEIAQEIHQDLDFLTSPLQDMPDRHRSLRAVFDHSWSLLSEDERALFRRLPVFRGGFYRKAVEEITGASLPLISALIRKSFLYRDSAGRYGMLEVLRLYALEKLEASPIEWQEVHNAHCSHYAGLLRHLQGDVRGKRQMEALARIGEEIENVRVAWQWAVDHRHLEELDRLLESWFLFCDMQGRFHEGERTCGKAVEALRSIDGTQNEVVETVEAQRLLGRVLARQGHFLHQRCRLREGRALLEESEGVLRDLDTHQDLAYTLKELGTVAYKLGERNEAKDRYLDAKAAYEKIDHHLGVADCLNNLGIVAMMEQDLPEAKRCYEESLAIYQQLGSQWSVAISVSNLSLTVMAMGDYEQAKQLLEKGLAIQRKVGDPRAIANGLSNLGIAAVGLNDHGQAEAYFRESLQTAIDANVAYVALEALVGTATLLTEEGRTEAAERLVENTLRNPVIFEELQGGVEQIFAELNSQLSTVAIQPFYEALMDQAVEIRKKAELLRTGPRPCLSTIDNQVR